MPRDETPTNPFAALYWRCLYEFKARNFKFAERRLLEKVADLTYWRGQADIGPATRDDLAESVGSTRHNLQPIIEALISRNVLGHDERLETWWLKPIDLWQVATGDPGDPRRAERAAIAEARIIAHDRLRTQPELIPRETTDAEVAAEGQQAHAADWPVTDLPSAVTSPPSAVPLPSEALRSKFQNEPAKGGPVNFRTAVPKNNTPVLKFSTPVANFTARAETSDARVREGAGPGYQGIKKEVSPGKPGGEEPVAPQNLPPLGHAAWSLLKDLEAFCVAGGNPPFTDEQRRHWAWRAKNHPLRLEMCLRETMHHVQEGRRPTIRSRAGWIKNLWREEESRATPPAPADDDPLARQAREELEKHFGKGAISE